MKYKCDMIRDLMPLCMDDVASESSKKVVMEHIADCKDCVQYYNSIMNEISLDSECSIESEGYFDIAKKIRRRKIITRTILSFVICVIFALLGNYAEGYRFTAKSAAALSGRIHASSNLIGHYDWGDIEFYIYDSDTSYVVVTAKKYWNGWKAQDNCLVWPKLSSEKGGMINAGSMYYWTDTKDKFGIQILPMIVEDTKVLRVEVSMFNKIKTIEAKPDKLTILTFENDNPSFDYVATGYAYDASGNVLYELVKSEESLRLIWQKVKE